MTDTRRNILKVLGFTGLATGGLISTEAIAEPTSFQDVPNLMIRGLETQHRIADALESLAKHIRSGGASAVGLKIESEVKPDTWLSHRVIVDVELLKDGES